MAKLVNLKRTRKQKAREARRADADANAASHGRSRQAREAEERALKRARDLLEQHRIERDD